MCTSRVNLRHGYAHKIDDANKEIKKLKGLISQWEDDKETCDTGSVQQIKDCEESVDKRIEEAEDDIVLIEKAKEKAEKEIEELLDDECKNYDEPCE